MDFLYRVIGTPLGWVMWLWYQITNNYAVALFLFTLTTRLLMVPLTIRQQKTTAKMAIIQPQIQQIQKKYEKNKEKMNEEMMKLYQEQGYNPMSGCLPLLIQMPILFGLIDVIYRPLKHILRLPADVVTAVEEIALNLGLVKSISGLNASQIMAVQSIRENVQPWITIGQENIDKILTLDLNLLGINLGQTPQYSMFSDIVTQFSFNPLLLVPLLSGASALAMSLVTMRNNSSQAAAAGSMKGMMLMMPLMSFFIAFSVPAGVGIYWFYSNLIALVQGIIMNKVYNPKEMAEKAKAELEEKQEKERQERIEAKKRAKENKGDADETALSQKEINRRKLAEARKRDAEKYGETYADVTDDDLN